MAKTTTAANACNGSIYLDNAAGVLTDISGSSNSVTISITDDFGTASVFQNEWPIRKQCGKDASFDLKVVFSTTATEAYQILKNWKLASPEGTRTLNIYVPSKNVGSDKWVAEVYIESMEIPMDRGEAGPIMVSAKLLPDGAVTCVVNAT